MDSKELLKSKDLHGAQLARRLGYNRTIVSAWVKGRSKPGIDVVPKIAEILDVSVAEVVACFTDNKEG